MNRCIFVHINKTGGSSVETALGMPFGHVTAREFIAQLGWSEWDSAFRFSFVRNPWDKVVSHYHYRVMTNQTDLARSPLGFSAWVERAYGAQDPRYYDTPKMFMPQLDWLKDDDGNVSMDYVGRFENLQNDFRTLCEKLDVAADLPHLKASKRGHYHDYFTKKASGIIGNWFAEDIDYFNYDY